MKSIVLEQESQANTLGRGPEVRTKTASSQEAIETRPILSGTATISRVIPRIHESLHEDSGKGEPTVIIHEPENKKTGPRFTRPNPLVYEAMPVLREWEYIPIRLTEPTIPLSLIGLKGSRSILVLVLRSRKPVPRAASLREAYPKIVAYLCSMAATIEYRIMIWVYSLQCGWRYYLVYPGGLRNDLDFPRSLEK